MKDDRPAPNTILLEVEARVNFCQILISANGICSFPVIFAIIQFHLTILTDKPIDKCFFCSQLSEGKKSPSPETQRKSDVVNTKENLKKENSKHSSPESKSDGFNSTKNNKERVAHPNKSPKDNSKFLLDADLDERRG